MSARTVDRLIALAIWLAMLAMVFVCVEARGQGAPPDGSSSGGSGTVTTSAPISGDGSSGSPIACTSASGAAAGCVTTGTQTLGGKKTFAGGAAITEGTEALPGLAAEDDADTGIRLAPAANTITMSTSATTRLTLTDTSLTLTLPMLAPAGSDVAPGYAFSVDPDTGLTRVSADVLGFVTGGTERVQLGSSALTSWTPLRGPNGSASNPSFGYDADADGTGLGWFRQAANVNSTTNNGVETTRLSASEFRLLGIPLWAGTIRDGSGNQQLFFSTISGSTWSNQASGAVNPAFEISNTNAITTGTLLRLRSGGVTHAEMMANEFRTVDGVYLTNGNYGATAPPAGDCDSDTEIGRGYLDITVSPRREYVCTGAAGGWDYKTLTD